MSQFRIAAAPQIRRVALLFAGATLGLLGLIWLLMHGGRAFASPAPRVIVSATAYERAAVQCRGTNAGNGLRCRRMTKELGGYCYRHRDQVPGPGR